MNGRRQFVQEALLGVAALIGLSIVPQSEAIAQIEALGRADHDGTAESRYQIPPGDGVNFDTKNDIIIARAAGMVYAFSLACPHQSTMLRWNVKERRFQCPKHQSRYTPTGEFISGRATRNMDRLPIRLDGNMVVVDNTKEIRSDVDAAGWAAAVVKVVG